MFKLKTIFFRQVLGDYGPSPPGASEGAELITGSKPQHTVNILELRLYHSIWRLAAA